MPFFLLYSLIETDNFGLNSAAIGKSLKGGGPGEGTFLQKGSLPPVSTAQPP